MHARHSLGAIAICAAILTLPAAADAQTRGLITTTSRPANVTPGVTHASAAPAAGASAAPAALTQSYLFGTITGINAGRLIVRLRSGALETVDASAAIAHGTYSAPLFVGKIILAEGAHAGSIFVAQRITRVTSLDQTSSDR